MQEKKAIGFFGGSFNPPLNSHIELAEKIIRKSFVQNSNEDFFITESKRKETCVIETNINIERIVFVPVSCQYNKQGLISDEHRYNMLKLICDANSSFSVSTIEIDSNRQLYTIETLYKMREIYNGYEIYFILGTDNLKELHTWKDIDRLLSEFKIIVMQRDNDNIEQILENEVLKRYKESFIILDKNIKINLSSTYVRKLIREGKEYKQYMPEDVYNYINKNQLYR